MLQQCYGFKKYETAMLKIFYHHFKYLTRETNLSKQQHNGASFSLVQNSLHKHLCILHKNTTAFP